MRTKTSLIFIFIITCGFVFSQKNETLKIKLQNSLKYQDYFTAIKTVNEIISISSDNNLYKDTLLSLFIYSNQNTSALLLASELEKEGNVSTDVLRVLANYNNII